MDRTYSNKKRSQRMSKRKRLHRILKYLRLTVFVCAAAFLIIFIINLSVARPSEKSLADTLKTGTFADGVTINGTDVSGMTFSQAQQAVIPAVDESMQQVGISVVYKNNIWLLNAADLGITADMDSTLKQALLFEKKGNKSENKQALQQLENGVEFTVELVPDVEKFTSALNEIAENFSSAPKEPSAEPDVWASSPEFNYIEGVPGYSFDANALISEVTAKFAQGEYTQTVTPDLVYTEPTKTLEEIQANTVLRAKFTTEYGSSSTLREKNRIANILKAANILRGATIEPGEEFSFNEHIGPRSEMGGWPPAPGIVNGNTYELQAGGGICQVSTTLYNALLRCGSEIEITNRKHHSWPSSYVDYGLDATVSTGGPDLAFRNNTGSTLYIFAYADNEDYKMTVYIYGAPLGEGVSYDVYSEITETLPKPTPVIEERADWPTGYKEVDYKSREGYIVEVYRQKLVNGEKVGDKENLYTDKYRAITGKTFVGTGDSSLPEP